MKELRIAHIDDAMTWRGGERQALELIKGLRDRGVENILVCRSGSELDRRAEKSGIERAHLPLRGEWDVISAFRMRSLFFRRKVQIAHAHTAHAHTIALMAVAGQSREGWISMCAVFSAAPGNMAHWSTGSSRFPRLSDGCSSRMGSIPCGL